MRAIATIQGLAGDTFCAWPLYGLQHFKDCAAEMVLVWVLCALRLQRSSGKPIVLLSFSPHEQLPKWAQLIEAMATDLITSDRSLQSLQTAVRSRYRERFGSACISEERLISWARAIGSWFDDKTLDDSEVVIYRGYDATSGHWVDISDKLRERLAQRDSRSVHIIEVGPLPLDVFHACLLHCTIPPIIEGQTASNFMTSLGHPFVQVLRSEHVIKNGYALSVSGMDFTTIAEEACRVALLVRDLVPAPWLMAESTLDPVDYLTGIDQIARWIESTADARSELRSYFEAMARHFAKNSEDKFVFALLALREVVCSMSITFSD